MSKIEWTDKTWNPTTGCNKVSQGCKHCYAEKQHFRLQHMHPHKYTKAFSAGVETHKDALALPYTWKNPCRVFVNSMSDLFHADVPFDFIREVYCVMLLNQKHTFQILTKRPERMVEFYKWFDEYQSKYDMGSINYLWRDKANIWMGTSCEDQATANQRIPYLLQVPAAVRFLSCEPLLGPIDLGNYFVDGLEPETNWIRPIDWIITGGESGRNARPVHPDWVRSLRDQCQAAAVPFFFKQWGEYGIAEKGKPHPVKKWFWVCENGYVEEEALTGPFKHPTLNHALMLKCGKHASGNTLDGNVYEEFPETKAALST